MRRRWFWILVASVVAVLLLTTATCRPPSLSAQLPILRGKSPAKEEITHFAKMADGGRPRGLRRTYRFPGTDYKTIAEKVRQDIFSLENVTVEKASTSPWMHRYSIRYGSDQGGTVFVANEKEYTSVIVVDVMQETWADRFARWWQRAF
jgi:hypothetical protein